MGNARRLLALAAAFNTVLAAGVATAQTVIVIGAPRESAIELLFNNAKIGSATADASGSATFPLNLFKPGDKTETDAHVVVDTCEALHRIELVEPGQEALVAGPGCARREFTELFIVRQVTTLVVDVFAERQAVWIRQGTPPAAWLDPDRQGIAPPPELRPSPKGLVFSGGGSFSKFANAILTTCGSAETCSGKSSRPGLSGAVAYWLTPFLAAEAGVLKPTNLRASGSGTGYSFESSLETLTFTFSGKLGYAHGPFRGYGQGGATLSRTMAITNETFDDYTYTVDDETVTVLGGEQTFVLRTQGWGWMFGGGGEFWFTRWFGVYGEISYLALKGSTRDAGEGKINERLTSYVVGVRLAVRR
jgi:hypothetical protein